MPDRRKRDDAATGIAVAAMLGLFAFLLFVLAVAALPSRLIALSGNAAREALLAGKSVTDDDLNDFIAGRERALAFRRTGETLDDLALASFQRAQRKGLGTTEGQRDLTQAIAWQKQSLERAPANSYGWIRLAQLLLQTEGISAQAANALARSLETNPYEPRMDLARLNMAVLLEAKLDAETKARIPALIRNNWRHDPQALVKDAQDNHYASVAESALAQDKQALAALHGLLAPMPKAVGAP